MIMYGQLGSQRHLVGADTQGFLGPSVQLGTGMEEGSIETSGGPSPAL